MKFLMIFLIFTISAMSADTYVFHVNSPEMVEQYSLVFNAMKSIFEADSYISMLRFVFLLGGFIALAGGIFNGFTKNMNGALSGYFKYIAVGVSLLVLLFVGKSDLIVKSTSTGSYCESTTQNIQTISNFPTLLGFSFNYINRLGNSITGIAEQEFTTVNSVSGSIKNGGYMHSIRDSVRILDTNLEDDYNLSTNDDLAFQMKSFFTQCMIVPFSGKGDVGEKELAILKSNNNIYSYLETLYTGTGKNIGGINSKDYSLDVNGEIYTCGNYYNKIKVNLDEFKTHTLCLNKVDESALALIVGNSTPPSSSLQDVSMQAGLIASLESTYKELGIGTGAIAYAAGKTKAGQVQENIANGEYMATMLPLIQSILRIILFGFFPFVFIVVLFPGGLQVLGHYLKSLLWVELWTPVAAVLNMFLNFRAKEQMGQIYNSDGLTMINAIDMTSETAVIAGVAGYLYMTIPGLTWSFISGTAMMIEKLGMSFGKGMMKNIRTESMNLDIAKSETNKEMQRTTGNYDLSLAETQHFNAVSEGRISGAVIGKKGQKDLDLMANISAKNAGLELLEYKTVKSETGLGGAEQGAGKVSLEVMERVTNVNTIRENIQIDGELATVALNTINADSVKELGKMNAQHEERDIVTGSKGKEFYSGVEKSKITQNLANVETLKGFGDGTTDTDSINKQAKTTADGNIANLHSTDGFTNDGKERESIGRTEGENKNFNVKATDAEQSYLQNEGGETAKTVGKSAAITKTDTITKQDADKNVDFSAGGDTNNDGQISESEHRAIRYIDNVLSTKLNKEEFVEKKDEDGNIIYDKDGKPELELIGAVSENYFVSKDGKKGEVIKSTSSEKGQYEQRAYIRTNMAERLQESLNDKNGKYKNMLENIAHSGTNVGNTKGELLLETIAHGEGTSDAIAIKHGFKNGYQITYGHGKYVPKGTDITKMTFSEIYDLRKVMLRNQAGNKLKSTAMGKYQFTGATLKEYQRKLGYSNDTKFTKEVQDAMGMRLLQDSGLRAYINGDISKAQFQNKMAERWASIARYDTGKSQYGQHTGTSTKTIQASINGDSRGVRESQMEDRSILNEKKFNRASKEIYTNKEIQEVYSNLEEAGQLVRAISPLVGAAGILGGVVNHAVKAIADNQKKKKKLKLAIAKRKHQNYIRKLKREVELSNRTIDEMMKLLGSDDEGIKREMKKQSLDDLKKIKEEADRRKYENIDKAEEIKNKKIKNAKASRAKQLRADQKRFSFYSKKKEEIHKDTQKKELKKDEIRKKENEFKESKSKLEASIKNVSNLMSQTTDFNEQRKLQNKLNALGNKLNVSVINHNSSISRLKNSLTDNEYIKRAKATIADMDKKDAENKAKIVKANANIDKLDKDTNFKKDILLPKIKEDLLKLDNMAMGLRDKDELLKLVSESTNKEEFLRSNEKINQSIIEKKKELLKEKREVEKQLALNEKQKNKNIMEKNFAKTKMISFISESDRIDAYNADKEFKIKQAEKEFQQKVEFEEKKVKTIQSAIDIKEIQAGNTKGSKDVLDMEKIAKNILIKDNLTNFSQITGKRSKSEIKKSLIAADDKKYTEGMSKVKKDKSELMSKVSIANHKSKLKSLLSDFNRENNLESKNKSILKRLNSEIIKIENALEQDKINRNNIRLAILDLRKNRNSGINEFNKLQSELNILKEKKEVEARRGVLNNKIRKSISKSPIGKDGIIGKAVKHIANVATFGDNELFVSTNARIKELNLKLNEIGASVIPTQQDRYKFLHSARHSKVSGLLTNEISISALDNAILDNTKLKDSADAKRNISRLELKMKEINRKLNGIPGFDGKNITTAADIRRLELKEKSLISQDIVNALNKYEKEIASEKSKILSIKEENKIQNKLNIFENKIRKNATETEKRIKNSLILNKEKAQKKVYKKYSKKIKQAEDGMVEKFKNSKYYKEKTIEIEQFNRNRDVMTNIIGEVVEKSSANIEMKDKINESFIKLEQDNNDKNRKELNKLLKELKKSGMLNPSELKTIDSLNERAQLFAKKSSTLTRTLNEGSKNAKKKGTELGRERAIYSSRHFDKNDKFNLGLKSTTKTLLEWTKNVNKKTLNIGGKTTGSVWNNINKQGEKVTKTYYEDLMKKDTKFRSIVNNVASAGKLGGVMIVMAEAENQAKGLSENHIGNVVKHGLGMTSALAVTGAKGYYNIFRAYDDGKFIDDGWDKLIRGEELVEEMEKRNNKLDKDLEYTKLSDEEYISSLIKLNKDKNKVERDKLTNENLHKDIMYVMDARREYLKYENVFGAVIKQQDEANKDYAKSTLTGGKFELQDTIIEKAYDAYKYIKDNVTEARYEEFKNAISKLNDSLGSSSRPISIIERDLKEEFGRIYMEAKLNDLGHLNIEENEK